MQILRAPEYAILVRSDLKGQGLGWMLMHMIIEYARVEGVRAVRGQVLNHNHAMLDMCKKLGFTVGPDPQKQRRFSRRSTDRQVSVQTRACRTGDPMSRIVVSAVIAAALIIWVYFGVFMH